MNTNSKKPVNTGKNISKYRLFRGYSQAGLAHAVEEKLGRPVSQQLISDLEDRETVKDEEMLAAIADILNVPVEVLTDLDLDTVILPLKFGH